MTGAERQCSRPCNVSVRMYVYLQCRYVYANIERHVVCCNYLSHPSSYKLLEVQDHGCFAHPSHRPHTR